MRARLPVSVSPNPGLWGDRSRRRHLPGLDWPQLWALQSGGLPDEVVGGVRVGLDLP